MYKVKRKSSIGDNYSILNRKHRSEVNSLIEKKFIWVEEKWYENGKDV